MVIFPFSDILSKAIPTADLQLTAASTLWQ